MTRLRSPLYQQLYQVSYDSQLDYIGAQQLSPSQCGAIAYSGITSSNRNINCGNNGNIICCPIGFPMGTAPLPH